MSRQVESRRERREFLQWPGSLISITHIEVLPDQERTFRQRVGEIIAAARSAPGCIDSAFHVDGHNYYTMTAWLSREDMERFRDKSPHGEAMERMSTSMV